MYFYRCQIKIFVTIFYENILWRRKLAKTREKTQTVNFIDSKVWKNFDLGNLKLNTKACQLFETQHYKIIADVSKINTSSK